MRQRTTPPAITGDPPCHRHFQLAIQQETPGLPKFRTQRIFGGGSAHSEGWALYAERLVVDTGLHSMGWTRQQAIDYGIGAQEVERYVVWPGQACAYMLGMLRILELRGQARAALGDKFSLAAFHDVVLPFRRRRRGSVG